MSDTERSERPTRTHSVRAVYVPIPVWECRGCLRRWTAGTDAVVIERERCRP